MLEFLAEGQNKKLDIYLLADELGLILIDLLHITEVAELLGFATIDKGDITLTPLGETFTEASITARKEIFGARVKRIPLFNWLINMLKADENQQLKREVIQAAMELEFPAEEAEEQIDTMIQTGGGIQETVCV